MIVDLVTFRVRRGKEQEFERHAEEWIRQMRRSRGFITQSLMRGAEDPSEYRATIRWVNREYRDRFNGQETGEAKALVKRASTILESPPVHCLLEQV